MFVYILIACSMGNGHGYGSACISVEFPDNQQCISAGNIFKKRFENNFKSIINPEVWYYCQQIKGK